MGALRTVIAVVCKYYQEIGTTQKSTDKIPSVGNEVGVAIGIYVGKKIGVAVGIAVGKFENRQRLALGLVWLLVS